MQILLDHDRYERLEKEATRRRQSVGATVRDAIDLLLEEDVAQRLAARRALLRMRTSATQAEFDKDATLKDALK